MNEDLKKILLTEDQIASKVEELANAISGDYPKGNVLFLGVLKGSVFFITDLMRKMKIDVKVDFMAVSSYGDSSESSGIVRILKDLDADIEGKDVIIVEDIIDTGTTLKYLYEYLKGRNPRTLKICALLDKPERRKVEINVDYTGYQIPDEFVVGYGIDYAEGYRYLPYIGALKEDVYKK